MWFGLNFLGFEMLRFDQEIKKIREECDSRNADLFRQFSYGLCEEIGRQRKEFRNKVFMYFIGFLSIIMGMICYAGIE